MLNISNYYEHLVTDQLWKMTEDNKITKDNADPLTQTFIEDVACLALNKLPPCYVRNVVDKGAHITDLQFQEMSTAVAKAIDEAIEQVRRRPHDARNV